MEINVDKNYQVFLGLIQKYVTRDGVEGLLDFLKNSDVKTAPASAKYHLSQEGGLIQHQLNVMNNLVKLIKTYYPKFPEECPYNYETIIIVSLLSNLSKVNFYGVDYRNVKDSDGVWTKEPFYKVRDDSIVYGSQAINNVYLLSQFITLTYEESLAILHQNGTFGRDNGGFNDAQVISAFKKSKLARLLSFADIDSTCDEE